MLRLRWREMPNRGRTKNERLQNPRLVGQNESLTPPRRVRGNDANGPAELTQASKQQLANIREKVVRIEAQLADALAQIAETEASIKTARVPFDVAERNRVNSESAHVANQQLIKELRDAVKQAAKDIDDAESNAKLTRQEEKAARRLADEALRSFESLQKEAERLAEEADLAFQNVDAADETLRLLLSETSADGLGTDVGTDHVYSLNFKHQDGGAFKTVINDSKLVAGQLHLIPEAGNATIAVFNKSALPERSETRVYTTIRADELPGKWLNGFIVFDYEPEDNFKNAGADRRAIEEVIDGQ